MAHLFPKCRGGMSTGIPSLKVSSLPKPLSARQQPAPPGPLQVPSPPDQDDTALPDVMDKRHPKPVKGTLALSTIKKAKRRSVNTLNKTEVARALASRAHVQPGSVAKAKRAPTPKGVVRTPAAQADNDETQQPRSSRSAKRPSPVVVPSSAPPKKVLKRVASMSELRNESMKLRKELEEERGLRVQLSRQVAEHQDQQQDLVELAEGMRLLRQEFDSLQTRYSEQMKLNEAQTLELQNQSQELHDKTLALASETANHLILQAQLAEKTQLGATQALQIRDAQKQLEKYEADFRHLHEVIQELKGNIRVCVRVRPKLSWEMDKVDCTDPGRVSEASSDSVCTPFIRFPDAKRLVLEGAATKSRMEWTKQARNLTAEFEYDRVFSPDSSQTIVFQELEQLILSAMHGYNVTVLAYGQTGSGKTYTMEGGPEPSLVAEQPESEGAGVIPRAVRRLFLEKARQEALGWNVNLYVSFMELYNEVPKDLIPVEETPVRIRCPKDEVIVEGLAEHHVATPQQMLQLLKKGVKVRVVGATKSNEVSSRSHAVFRVRIATEKDKVKLESVLSLVDLAGSENLKESGSEGQRKTETAHINRSLSFLKRVITLQAVSNNNKSQQKGGGHIPFRDSQLTLLLRKALGGGNSKTLLLANVSPLLDNLEETRRTLDFAHQASTVNIGVATKAVAK